jgi:hypothetical protein
MAYKEVEIVEEDGRRVTRKRSEGGKEAAKTGISFGAALAMVISYTNWHSVGLAIIHGLLSWVYVIYYIIRY